MIKTAGTFCVPTEPHLRDGLATEVRAALKQTGQPHLHDIEVRLSVGCVVLEGFVPTYYAKQVAQQVVLALDVAVQVDNQIEVV